MIKLRTGIKEEERVSIEKQQGQAGFQDEGGQAEMYQPGVQEGLPGGVKQ